MKGKLTSSEGDCVVLLLSLHIFCWTTSGRIIIKVLTTWTLLNRKQFKGKNHAPKHLLQESSDRLVMLQNSWLIIWLQYTMAMVTNHSTMSTWVSLRRSVSGCSHSYRYRSSCILGSVQRREPYFKGHCKKCTNWTEDQKLSHLVFY